MKATSASIEINYYIVSLMSERKAMKIFYNQTMSASNKHQEKDTR